MFRTISVAVLVTLCLPVVGFSQTDVRAVLAPDLELPPAALTKIYEEQYRLLINVVYVQGTGLRVATVDPRGPGANMKLRALQTTKGILEPNDTITHVGGQPITSIAQFLEVLTLAQGRTTISVFDPSRQRSVDWDVQGVKVQAPAQPPQDSRSKDRVVHAILVGDTEDAGIGAAAQLNLTNIERSLKSGIPAEFLKIYNLAGSRCTAKSIIETIRAIDSTNSDTIFYYHICHGAYDSRFAAGDPSGGQFFQLKEGDLLRRTLFDHVMAKPSRLKVVFTESCNVPAIAHPTEVRTEERTMTADKAQSLEQLLRYHRGYVDLNAASHDQFAWVSDVGGWFTYVSLQTFQTEPGWDTFLPKLKNETSAFYKRMREKGVESARMRDLLGKSPYKELLNQPDMNPAVYRLEIARDKDIEHRPPVTLNYSVHVLADVERN